MITHADHYSLFTLTYPLPTLHIPCLTRTFPLCSSPPLLPPPHTPPRNPTHPLLPVISLSSLVYVDSRFSATPTHGMPGPSRLALSNYLRDLPMCLNLATTLSHSSLSPHSGVFLAYIVSLVVDQQFKRYTNDGVVNGS